jgi:hypothetical protein
MYQLFVAPGIMLSRKVIVCIYTSTFCAQALHAQETQDVYARYATPGECAMVLNRMEKRFWRDKRPDTLYTGPLGRAPQRASVDAVRTCVARFRLEATPDRDLLALGYAYVRAEEFDKADAAFAKLLVRNAEKPVAQRANALVQIIDMYIAARPSRIDKAREYLALLDALGVPAAAERASAHLTIYGAARMADNVPLLETEAKAAVKASNEIAIDSVRRQRAGTAASARSALAHWHLRRNEAEAAIAVLVRGGAELKLLRTRMANAFRKKIGLYTLVGKPAAAIQAVHWYNDDAHGKHPSAGRPTVVVFASHGCGDKCYSGYAVAKRLKSWASGTNVSLVFVTSSEGYYRQQIVAAEQEFELSRQYFLEYLQLPVTLGSWRTEFGRRADGRLSIRTNPNVEAYRPDEPLQTYVIDRGGKVRFVTVMSSGSEEELRNIIRSVSE